MEVAGSPETYGCPRCGAVSAWFCRHCGSRTPGMPTIEGMCSLCRTKTFVGGGDMDRCTEPGCAKTAAEHRTEFRSGLARWGERQGRMKQVLGRVVPPGDLDRPAAAWSDQDRTQRAMDALTAYREHLRRQSDAEVPF